eukprot:m51a1_g11689 hypothetical protein (132) ;mRNA; r:726-4352
MAWLEQLLDSLRKKRDVVAGTLRRLPQLRWYHPQATGLLNGRSVLCERDSTATSVAPTGSTTSAATTVTPTAMSTSAAGHKDDLLPTALGLGLACTSSFLRGKYKGHVVKIQVVVNNQGIPMDGQGWFATT